MDGNGRLMEDEDGRLMEDEDVCGWPMMMVFSASGAGAAEVDGAGEALGVVRAFLGVVDSDVPAVGVGGFLGVFLVCARLVGERLLRVDVLTSRGGSGVSCMPTGTKVSPG